MVGLLEIDLPPKLEAYFQSFDFALFAMPNELNSDEKAADERPNGDRDESEANEGHESSEIESPRLLVQQFAFVLCNLLLGAIFLFLRLLMICTSERTQDKIK